MRKDLIEQNNSKLFYIFDTTDTTEQSFFSFSDSEKYKNLKYLLHLYAVALDRRKIRINLKVDDVFFDIKLKEQYSVEEYVKELDPNSYEVITRQPFDSSETFNFLHLYYNNHKIRKLVLDKLDEKENKL